MGSSTSRPSEFISENQTTSYGSLLLTEKPSDKTLLNSWELLDVEAFDFQIVNHPDKQHFDSNSSFEFVDHPGDSLGSGVENRVVLYYTSLRGIRKTYEDSCAVRVIFSGFRVCVDEKDISMDQSYRIELTQALKGHVTSFSLPQVFIKGKYIGGVEEIKQLNEGDELAKLLEGCVFMDSAVVCECCGDVRFVPCSSCSGSRKVYEEEEGGVRMCGDCNENGLIRCSICCH